MLLLTQHVMCCWCCWLFIGQFILQQPLRTGLGSS
jgi:hypothetical protein